MYATRQLSPRRAVPETVTLYSKSVGNIEITYVPVLRGGSRVYRVEVQEGLEYAKTYLGNISQVRSFIASIRRSICW